MNTPNWIKNSGKPKKTKGIAKGRRRQAKSILKAIKDKYMRDSKKGSSFVIMSSCRNN